MRISSVRRSVGVAVGEGSGVLVSVIVTVAVDFSNVVGVRLDVKDGIIVCDAVEDVLGEQEESKINTVTKR